MPDEHLSASIRAPPSSRPLRSAAVAPSEATASSSSESTLHSFLHRNWFGQSLIAPFPKFVTQLNYIIQAYRKSKS